MLIQILGFSHPEDLFRDDFLPDVFRRLWHYVASVCFRSTEAFADYLRSPVAMRALANEPLLSMSKKQQGMIGADRYRQSMSAQLDARGLGVSHEVKSSARPLPVPCPMLLRPRMLIHQLVRRCGPRPLSTW